MKTPEDWVKHYSTINGELNSQFLNLTVDSCRETLKEANIPFSGATSYDSAENRVFGFDEVVVKFYRPGRWKIEALEEELRFLEDLRDENVSFVRPLGKVGTYKGIHFLLFERVKNPIFNDREVLDEQSVKAMVQLVAKIHEVGRKRDALARAQFNPSAMSNGCFEVIQKAGFLPKDLQLRYQNFTETLVKKFSEFGDIPLQRIHGDTYTGNVMWTKDGPVFMDLDDFQVGPVALDIKLLSFPWRLDSLPEEMDRKERRKIQNDMVLKFYREVSEFPSRFEKIFPLLSAYRDIQFDAWFSSCWKEPGFAKKYEDDDITNRSWWLENLDHLEGLLN
jgi:Ser/Thr protein kinase RdoA (MazF antagonist)